MTDGSDKRPEATGFQRWVVGNRSKIWIWGIAILALGGIGCMFLTVLLLIITR